MVAEKFLHLKHLNICLGDEDDEDIIPTYDYLSLASFLNASPVLESFILTVDEFDMKHDFVFAHMRQITEHKHDKLKKVQINGFCSAKSMVELTYHILENATSLESLTLDTIFGWEADCNKVRCSGRKTGKCRPKGRNMVLEAHKAFSVIKRYILERVPSTVKLNVGEPCSRCHAI
uniref:At1g61320/AtMIF1 LRR domain-containing protein n=1 Tax=Arundo donax TaxID=35708 RepID=A0A0A9DXL6_ARUDO